MKNIRAKQDRKKFGWRIFFVALVLRLIPVLLYYDLPIGLDDMFQYDMLARSIVAGDGYRWYAEEDLHLAQQLVEFDLRNVELDPRGVLTSFKPPLYPAFLALIYFLTGVGVQRFFIVRLIQTIMGAALAPLLYALTHQFFSENEKAARGAAWVVTLYPMLIVYPIALATENLFFPLVLLATLSLLVAAEKGKVGYFVLTGLLMGLSALTRSTYLAVAGLCLLWLCFGLGEWKSAIILFASLLVVVAPWIVRNSILNQGYSGIESGLGYSLYMGYHPDGTGTFEFGNSLDLLSILDDGERERAGLEAAKEFILDDPGRIPYLMLRKLGHFFSLERRGVTYFYSNNFLGYVSVIPLVLIGLLMMLPFTIISTSAAFGLAISKMDKKVGLLILIMLGYIFPHVLIQAEPRFHLMMVPFFSILAAQFWFAGIPVIKECFSTATGGWAIFVASVVVLLLFMNWGLEIWRDADKLILLFGPNGNRAFLPY